MPWVFSSVNVFNFDLGYSYSEEQIREAIAPMLEAGPPPIVGTIPSSRGTDVRGYLTQKPRLQAFVLDDGIVYQTYETAGRGVEFLMGYYGILDRAPKGRDERRDAGVDPPGRRVLSTGSEPSAVNREASSRPRVLQVAGSRVRRRSDGSPRGSDTRGRCRNADSESAARRSRRSGSAAWGRPPPMARLRIDRR
jgi:hypothetical protein